MTRTRIMDELRRLRRNHPQAGTEHFLIMLAERFHVTLEAMRDRMTELHRAEQAASAGARR